MRTARANSYFALSYPRKWNAGQSQIIRLASTAPLLKHNNAFDSKKATSLGQRQLHHFSNIKDQLKLNTHLLRRDPLLSTRAHLDLPNCAIQSRVYYSSKSKRGTNILLMGSPGAGKTSVAKELSKQMGWRVVDIDDHLLEPAWGMTVAEKLAQVGGKDFLDLEAQTFLEFKSESSIISLTGSQPLNDEAMAHAHALGYLVYLDVQNEDILNRIAKMQVDRVIGQEKGVDMKSILKYRQQFYERHYDIRVICEAGESVVSIATRVQNAMSKLSNNKGYRSTRSHAEGDTFLDITIQGLAPDRGLYVSDSDIPYMTQGQWARLVGSSYRDCALKILEQWICRKDMTRKDLRSLIDKAYTHENFQHEDIAPIVPLEKNQYLLELFHGPTASFKDIALQLTARLFDYAVKKENKGFRSLILVATSGDTGGAVLNAFSRFTDRSEVVILFPEEGISSIQKAQMRRFQGPRALVLGLNGDFDYCQTTVKDIFTDADYDDDIRKRFGYSLSAANSINYARLLPQVVYHAWSYLVMVRDGHIDMGKEIDICVPTGNFGNILGAYYAKRMGIPIRHMTVASNSNNVLHEFFTTGIYDVSKRSLMNTASPAIDILKSSNLERYLYAASGKDYSLMTSLFKDLDMTGRFSIPVTSELFNQMQLDFRSDWCTDEESMRTIKEVFKRTGYMIDPHTAVAKTVADRNALGSDVPLVISSTAHFSKFSESILRAVGLVSEIHTNDPSKLLNKALKLTEKPKKHKVLWKDMQNAQHRRQTCEGSQDAIRGEIEKFLENAAKQASNKRKNSA